MDIIVEYNQLKEKCKKEFESLTDEHRQELLTLKHFYEIELEEIRVSLDKEMQEELREFKRRTDLELEKIKSRSTSMVASVLGVVILGISAFMYNASNNVFSNTASMNQSVITLQDRLLSAQESIKKAESELKASSKTGSDRIESSIKSLSDTESDLIKVHANLDAAILQLDETRKLYQSRIDEIKSSS
ncbi:hypothetical protein [Vibrio fluvialis]|uniref:hypothetical protein n=1 Tax=Vibrio fluvialis TaxID=676 RepID=UPI0006E3B558|nr:hypothetical protein [Vibrio fluvialis]KQH90578.1 hypothetical protein AMR75_07090 [Vibrio fluvialis]